MLEIADGVPDDILHDILQLRLRVKSPVTSQSQESRVQSPRPLIGQQVSVLTSHGLPVVPLGLGIQDSNFCQTSLNASNHLRLANIAKLSPPPYYLLLHTF